MRLDLKKYVAVLIFLLFSLYACSGEDAQKEKDKEASAAGEEVAQEQEGEGSLTLSELSEVDPSRSGMKKQAGGILMEKFSTEQELEMDVEEFISQNEQEITDYLQKTTEQTQNPKELVKAITHLLGTPNYTETIETAEDFQPDFADPDLPSAEKSKNTEGKHAEGRGKAILLLDASSSMLLSVDGKVKMDIAKEAVQQFAEVIGQENDVSLVVYGHKGSESQSDKTLSCEGIEEVYPLDTYNAKEFGAALNEFQSKGWTPLAGAIDKAAEMSKDLEGEITLYIVSDGVETCDGDPVESADSFVTKNEFRQVNIIGFNVDKDAEEQLKAVSEAGNGEYFAADNAEEFTETIQYEWLPSSGDLAWAFTKAPGPWEILDEYNLYDEERDKIKALIQIEDERYGEAISILRENEMISSEAINELNGIISGNYTARMDELSEMRAEKIDEIDSIADEIKQQVDEWKEDMEKKKEERGDVW